MTASTSEINLDLSVSSEHWEAAYRIDRLLPPGVDALDFEGPIELAQHLSDLYPSIPTALKALTALSEEAFQFDTFQTFTLLQHLSRQRRISDTDGSTKPKASPVNYAAF